MDRWLMDGKTVDQSGWTDGLMDRSSDLKTSMRVYYAYTNTNDTSD